MGFFKILFIQDSGLIKIRLRHVLMYKTNLIMFVMWSKSLVVSRFVSDVEQVIGCVKVCQ